MSGNHHNPHTIVFSNSTLSSLGGLGTPKTPVTPPTPPTPKAKDQVSRIIDVRRIKKSITDSKVLTPRLLPVEQVVANQRHFKLYEKIKGHGGIQQRSRRELVDRDDQWQPNHSKGHQEISPIGPNNNKSNSPSFNCCKNVNLNSEQTKKEIKASKPKHSLNSGRPLIYQLPCQLRPIKNITNQQFTNRRMRERVRSQSSLQRQPRLRTFARYFEQ